MKRRQKRREAILEDAVRRIVPRSGDYYWGRHLYYILVNIWTTAYHRGIEKGRKQVYRELEEEHAGGEDS